MIWLIGFGGSIGAVSRYLLGDYIKAHSKDITLFPLGTWFINIIGSCFLGFLASQYADGKLSEWIWYVAGIGFCGAFTTFSTFGYETITLIEMKKFRMAVLYVLLSVVIGFLSALMGFSL